MNGKKPGIFAGAVTSAFTGITVLLISVRNFFPWELPASVQEIPQLLAEFQRWFALIAGLPLSAALLLVSRYYYRLSGGEDYCVYLEAGRMERLTLFHAVFAAAYAASYVFLIRYFSDSAALALILVLPPLLTLALPLLDLRKIARNDSFLQPDTLWIDGSLELARFDGNADALIRWFREEPYRVVRGSRYRGISRRRLEVLCGRYASGEFYTVLSKGPGGPVPVGIAGFLGREMFLYVCVKHRRRGIGRKVLCRLISRMTDVGLGAAHAYELRSDPVSRKLYESLGFAPVPGKKRLVRYERAALQDGPLPLLAPQGESDSR